MPPVCSLCSRPDCPDIEAALVAGDSLRNIAERFGTSPPTLLRHREHIPRLLAKVEAAETLHGEAILEKVRGLEQDARRIAAKAEREGDLRCAVTAVRAVLDIVERLAELATAKGGPADGDDITNLSTEELALRVANLLATAQARAVAKGSLAVLGAEAEDEAPTA